MVQTAEMRGHLFTMRMSDEEWSRANTIATHLGLNVAGVIRMTLKEKARELNVEALVSNAPAPKKRAAKKIAPKK